MKRFVAVVLSLILLLLAGCSSAPSTSNTGQTGSDQTQTQTQTPSTTPQESKGPVTLTVSIGPDITTLDVQKQGKMIDMNVLLQIFDTLLTMDENGQIAPNLATEWRNVDPLTWEFKLRQDVKFHNGEPFNAEAVKFSIDRLLDPATKSPIMELQYVTSVDVIDEYTVQIKTSLPDPIIPAKLTLFPGCVVPPQYIKEVGDEGFAAHPVGTGPFKFVEWVKDDHVTLERNPDYWGEKAKVDRLVFKAMPNDASRVAALQAGDVDLITNVPPDSIPVIESTPGLKVLSVPGTRAFYVVLNTKNPDSPLAKKEVRQAMNYALDVPTLIDTVLGGHGQQIATLIPPAMFGYTDTVKPYEYNLEKAKQLMAEAGYPDGFEVTMDVTSGSYLKDKDTAIAIAGMLEKIGIKVNVNVMENASFVAGLRAQTLNDMYFIGNLAWTMDGFNNLQAFVKTDRVYSRFSNAEADELIDIEEQSTDPQVRLEAFQRLQEILKEEAPFLYLWVGNQIYAMSDKVTWNGPSLEVFHFNTASKQQ